MFDLIFVTSVWIQSRWLCWGILYDKFWYPQVHRYIGAGSGPGRHRSCRTVSFRWEWYNAQNEGECCTSSSSVCSRIPKTKQYKRLRLIISIHKIHITFRSVYNVFCFLLCFLYFFFKGNRSYPVNSRDGLESRRLLLLLTATLFYGGCLEEFLHKVFLGSRQKSHNVLVDWILVLLQPVGDVVSHRASVMTQREVRGWDSGPGRLSWFAKVGWFAHVVGVQFVLERLVVSLGEHAFLFKDGQDTHGLKDCKQHISLCMTSS